MKTESESKIDIVRCGCFCLMEIGHGVEGTRTIFFLASRLIASRVGAELSVKIHFLSLLLHYSLEFSCYF